MQGHFKLAFCYPTFTPCGACRFRTVFSSKSWIRIVQSLTQSMGKGSFEFNADVTTRLETGSCTRHTTSTNLFKTQQWKYGPTDYTDASDDSIHCSLSTDFQIATSPTTTVRKNGDRIKARFSIIDHYIWRGFGMGISHFAKAK